MQAEAVCPNGHRAEDALLVSDPVEVSLLTLGLFGGEAASIHDKLYALFCRDCGHVFGVVPARKKEAGPPLEARPSCPNGHPFQFGVVVLGLVPYTSHDRGHPTVVYCRDCGHTYGAVLFPRKKTQWW